MADNKFVLFPAYAGVIPGGLYGRQQVCAFPRICGGDPIVFENKTATAGFSPHMRGQF